MAVFKPISLWAAKEGIMRQRCCSEGIKIQTCQSAALALIRSMLYPGSWHFCPLYPSSIKKACFSKLPLISSKHLHKCVWSCLQPLKRNPDLQSASWAFLVHIISDTSLITCMALHCHFYLFSPNFHHLFSRFCL